MKERDRDYYLVTGGAALEIYKAFMEERTAQIQKRIELAKEFGAICTYGDSRSIIGLQFPGDPPCGWRIIRRTGDCYMPPAGKAWKALRERMRALPCVNLSDFHRRLHGDIGVFGGGSSSGTGFSIRYTMPEVIGGTLILAVPTGAKWKHPEGTKPIKTSEYWTLRESEEPAEFDGQEANLKGVEA